jgi:hypothetical protein
MVSGLWPSFLVVLGICGASLILVGWWGWLCHGDVVWNVGVVWFWGLTGWFWWVFEGGWVNLIWGLILDGRERSRSARYPLMRKERA